MELLKSGVIDNPLIDMLSTIIHEMIHMASSNYDRETGIVNIGFDSFKDDGTRISSNIGITEGMDEVITKDIISRMLEKDTNVLDDSGYKKEILFARQLRLLTEHNELYADYFNANGIDGVKNRIANYLGNNENAREDVDVLFEEIEECHDLSQLENDEGFKTNIPTLVQGKLLEVFREKLKSDIQSDIIDDVNSLNEYAGIIKKFLISPDNIQDNAEKLEGLENIPKKFERMKSQLVQAIALKNPEQNPDVPIYSPNSGGVLERNEDGNYYSEHEDVEYTVNANVELVLVGDRNNNEVSNDELKQGLQPGKFQYEDIKDVTSETKTSDVSRAYLDIKNDLANEKVHENNLKKEEKDYE